MKQTKSTGIKMIVKSEWTVPLLYIVLWYERMIALSTYDREQVYNFSTRVMEIDNHYCQKDCCGRCSDEKKCQFYGTCCPALMSRRPELFNKDAIIYRCMPSWYPSGGLRRNQRESYFMVSKCHASYSNPDDIKKCEEADERSSLMALVPATDARTRIIYRNRYCALCNFVPADSVLLWTPELTCTTSVLLPRTDQELLNGVAKINDCNIEFATPFYDLNPGDKCTLSISECNTTGMWNSYDRLTEWACHAYISEYTYSGESFGNVFCFMCNSQLPPPSDCLKGLHGFQGVAPRLSMLLDPATFVEPTTRTPNNRQCEAGFVHDAYKNMCRERYCSATRTLGNGTCHHAAMWDYPGLEVCYEMFIEFVPNENHSSSSDFQDEIRDLFISFLYLQNDKDTIDIKSMTLYSETASTNGNATDPLNVTSHPTYVGYISLGIYYDYFETENELFHFERELGNTHNKFGISLIRMVRDKATKTFLSRKEGTILAKLTTGHRLSTECTRVNNEIITISNTLNCVLIQLSLEDLLCHVNGSGLYIDDMDLRIEPQNFIENTIEERSVHVCEDAYLERANKLANGPSFVEENNATAVIVDYVSFAATVLSITCLCITIFTYLRFTSMLTQPGVNNIALSVSLIAAQACFQFGANQVKNVSPPVCAVIGFWIHFLWLNVIFWMNACCINMFKAFTSTKPVHSSKWSKKKTFQYYLYCTTGSAIFVTMNIIYSLVERQDENFGYGRSVCYISTNLMKIIAFIVPTVVLVMSNIVLYVIAAVTIFRTSVVQSLQRRSATEFLKIYGKLSTITGITWVFGFLFMFTGSKILEYVFIVLNAGQGVFVMLAFVCNRRVFDAYHECLCLKEETKTATTHSFQLDSTACKGHGNLKQVFSHV